MGIDVDEPLSPSLQEKVSYLGVLLKSFPQGEVATSKLLDLVLGQKRIERLTERIGAARVLERDTEAVSYQDRPLMQKVAGPVDTPRAEAVAIMADGGRYQRKEKNDNAKTHWHEYKSGLCLELGERPDGQPRGSNLDPCPHVPSFLLNSEQVETLTREIGQKAATVSESDDDDSINLNDVSKLPDLQRILSEMTSTHPAASARELPLSPAIEKRDVVATTHNSTVFGRLLVSMAWARGLVQAEWKAYVGDGQNWIWSVWEQHFKAFGFLPILDVIHAMTYVYAAATAGRSTKDGWPVYVRWIDAIWKGDVSKVILELANRQDQLGLPTDDDGETSPRRIVSDALTYLQNQQSRMDYPRYRKLGLPITSSHMESTMKELNYRIKGSEKFWSETGAEAVLQLKADTLCDSDPLAEFWARRSETRTGLHSCARSAA